MNKTTPIKDRKVLLLPPRAKFAVADLSGKLLDTFETKLGAEKYAELAKGTVVTL